MKIIVLFAFGISLNLLIHELTFSARPDRVMISLSATRVVTMAGIVIAQIACRYAGIVSTSMLFVTALVHWLTSIPDVYSIIDAPAGELVATMPPSLRLYAILHMLAMTAFLIASSFATRRSEKTILDHGSSPELQASFLSRLFFYWFSPVPSIGHRRALTSDDLFELNRENRSEHLVRLWERNWCPKSASESVSIDAR